VSQFETALREALDQAFSHFAAGRDQLKALFARVPVSPREQVMLLGEEAYDFATEVRTWIESALDMQLEPFLRDLRAVAAYPAGGKSAKKKKARRSIPAQTAGAGQKRLRKRRRPPLPTFAGGPPLVDVDDRNALEEAMGERLSPPCL